MSEEHRVSDAEREAAVVLLRDASTAGRLTLEELGDRTGLAYGAQTQGELVRVTADLPVTPTVPPGKGVGWLIGVFAPAVRRGRWRVARKTIAFSLFAPCELDFRAASLTHGESTVYVLSIFGPVRLVVPQQLDLDVSVFSIFAPTIHSDSPDPPPAGAPRLRVLGLTLFAPVLVKHRHS